MRSSADARGVARRIRNTGLGEALSTQLARVAVAARETVQRRIVAAQRERVVDAEREPELHDLALGPMQQRRLDANRRRALDSAARGEVGHALVCLHVLGTTVGIAG